MKVGHLVDVAVGIVADAIVVGFFVLLQANVVGLPEERLLFASVHGYRCSVEADRQHLVERSLSEVCGVRRWRLCEYSFWFDNNWMWTWVG